MSGVDRFLPAAADPTARLDASRGDALSRRLAAARESGDAASLGEAARDLESLFATFLVKELRKGLSEGFFGDGPGADTYASWLDDTLGKSIAEAGGLDLERVLEDAAGPDWDRLQGDVLAERLAARARGGEAAEETR